MSRWRTAWLSLGAVVIVGCGGGGASSTGGGAPAGGGDSDESSSPTIAMFTAGIDGFTNGTYTLVGSQRAGRTFFDYTYTVKVTNTGTVPLQAVTATVTSQAATTVVTDASLSFGDIAVGASATSTDTFTIRQDRSAPVADANLTIIIAGTPYVPPTSEQKIAKALADGEIDDETALVYRVYAVFGDPRLPAQYRGDDSNVFDSMVMGEVADRLATLSAENRAILEPFTIAPPYEGSWWRRGEAAAAAAPRIEAAGRAKPSAIPCPGCPDDIWSNVSQAGGHVRVWWRTTYPADQTYANTILNAVEAKIWGELTTLMGRAPLSDLLESGNGGDGLLDIYVLRFTGGTIGLTVAYPFGCDARPVYIGIDPTKPRHLPSAVAHELMHAIQFTYDVAHACSDYDWLGEATANWAMDFVYPAENYEHFWADDYLIRTDSELGKGYGYGDYLFPFYLARRYVPALVATIWNNTMQYDSRDAVDKAIPGGFKDQWPEFALYNWNRDAIRYYRDWDNLAYTSGDLTNMPWRVPRWNGAESAGLGGQPDTRVPFTRLKTDGQAMLSANYYHWVFDDDAVRTVIFNNGYTWDLKEEEVDPLLGTRFVAYDWSDPARDKAKVEALVKVGGIWKPAPEDWTNVGQRHFCRDRQSERIEELVLIFSNAEHQVTPPGNGKLMPPDQPPTFWLSNMACFRWVGFADYRSAVDGVTETLHANVTWTPIPLSTYFEASGTVEWHISGTDSGGCTHSGSGTVAIDTDPAYQRFLLTFNDYTAGPLHRAYTGFGLASGIVTQTIVCPDGSGGFTTVREPREAGMWFPGEQDPAYVVGGSGDAINGLFIVVDGGRWDWHFEAQRE
ncbi:MAG: hypothetical protein QG595_485 [Pseudomonadota bacterium]|nr:hypothetical protein [Pseudomonadota bacterium]